MDFDMTSIISTITDLLSGIPVIGDIIKMIMGLFNMGDESVDNTDGQ